MIRYSTTTTINRDPGQVYALLIDMTRYPEWTEMVDVRFAGPPRVGASGTFRLAKGPFKGTFHTRISRLEPDRGITWQTSHPATDWTATADLEPVTGGARLVYAGHIRLRGWRRLLEPLMAGEVSRAEAAEVERLKQLAESSGALAGASA